MAQCFKKLRLSLISSCNQSCFYCREGNNQLRKNECSSDELIRICEALTHLGMEEIRLTGGEPLLYPNLEEILKGLSKLSLKKISLTTNGVQLLENLPLLYDYQCRHLNVSLDSLDPKKFLFITKTDSFHTVLNALMEAKKRGFSLKINTVVMKGINDDELENFISFSKEHQIEVRFLELMRLGQVFHEHKNLFVSYTELISRIKQLHKIEPVPVALDSTAQIYSIDDKARIGFIASETTPFCGDCSRLRMDSMGEIRACLFDQGTISLKNLSFEEIEKTINKLLCTKPTTRASCTPTGMNTIGG